MDRAAEAAIAERLAVARPDHGLFGEEFGRTGEGSPWQWIVDPIDGTSGFVRGIPVWATLVALAHAERDGWTVAWPRSRPRRSAPDGGRRGMPARSSTGVVARSRRSTS